MTVGGEHNAIYTWCIIELYTWHLYTLINQCHIYDISIIHNCQKVEETQILIQWWMDKHTVTYSHNILFNQKKLNIDICHNTDEPWKQYAK